MVFTVYHLVNTSDTEFDSFVERSFNEIFKGAPDIVLGQITL